MKKIEKHNNGNKEVTYMVIYRFNDMMKWNQATIINECELSIFDWNRN